MNTNCYVCEKSIVGQCHDCGRSYCSQHGTSPYCVFCALRHDEPEPLRHALRFDVSVGYDDAKAEADRLAEELGRLKYWDPEAKGPFYEAKKADLPRLEAEAARIKPLADKQYLRQFFTSTISF